MPKIEHKFNHVLYDRNISSRGNAAKLVDYLNGMDAGDSDDGDVDDNFGTFDNKKEMLKKKPSIHLPPPPSNIESITKNSNQQRKNNKMAKDILKGKYYVPARPSMNMAETNIEQNGVEGEEDLDDLDGTNAFVVNTEKW